MLIPPPLPPPEPLPEEKEPVSSCSNPTSPPKNGLELSTRAIIPTCILTVLILVVGFTSAYLKGPQTSLLRPTTTWGAGPILIDVPVVELVQQSQVKVTALPDRPHLVLATSDIHHLPKLCKLVQDTKNNKDDGNTTTNTRGIVMMVVVDGKERESLRVPADCDVPVVWSASESALGPLVGVMDLLRDLEPPDDNDYYLIWTRDWLPAASIYKSIMESVPPWSPPQASASHSHHYSVIETEEGKELDVMVSLSHSDPAVDSGLPTSQLQDRSSATMIMAKSTGLKACMGHHGSTQYTNFVQGRPVCALTGIRPGVMGEDTMTTSSAVANAWLRYQEDPIVNPFPYPYTSPRTLYMCNNTTPGLLGTPKKYGVFTLISSDEYASSAAKLALSVRRHLTLDPQDVGYYVMLIQGRELHPSTMSALIRVGWTPCYIPRIPPSTKGHTVTSSSRFKDQFTKLSLWSMTHLQRAFFLDGDTLVVADPSAMLLLQDQEPFAAVHDIAGAVTMPTFNMGVFSVTPKRAEFDRLMDLRETMVDYDLGHFEQAFLNTVYNSSWKPMPFGYNGNIAMLIYDPNKWRSHEKDLVVLHYTMVKPWSPLSSLHFMRWARATPVIRMWLTAEPSSLVAYWGGHAYLTLLTVAGNVFLEGRPWSDWLMRRF